MRLAWSSYIFNCFDSPTRHRSSSDFEFETLLESIRQMVADYDKRKATKWRLHSQARKGLLARADTSREFLEGTKNQTFPTIKSSKTIATTTTIVGTHVTSMQYMTDLTPQELKFSHISQCNLEINTYSRVPNNRPPPLINF